jgi:hypothetical protein
MHPLAWECPPATPNSWQFLATLGRHLELSPVLRDIAATYTTQRVSGQFRYQKKRRRGRDSNPRSRFKPARRFSKPVPSANSATSPGLAFWCPDVLTPRTPAVPCVMRTIRRTTPRLDYSVFISLAEEEGFEPPELSLGGFQDRCLRPLGHSSGVPGGKTRGSIE